MAKTESCLSAGQADGYGRFAQWFDGILSLMDRVYAVIRPVAPLITGLLFVFRILLWIKRNLLLLISTVALLLLSLLGAVLVAVFQPPLITGPLQAVLSFVPFGSPLMGGLVTFAVLAGVLMLVNFTLIRRWIDHFLKPITYYVRESADLIPARQAIEEMGFVALPHEGNSLVYQLKRFVNHPLVLLFGETLIQATPCAFLVDEQFADDEICYLYLPIGLKRIAPERVRDFLGGKLVLERLEGSAKQQPKSFRKELIRLCWRVEYALFLIFPLTRQMIYAKASPHEVKLVATRHWLNRFCAGLPGLA